MSLRIPKLRRTYSPNQVVALNVVRARAMRGWTQEQASAALAPYLGTRLSVASFSAIERSIAGTRVKQFSADELVALSRGFDLPIGWFLLPPPPEEDAGLHAPDASMRGLEMSVLLDVILGTPESLGPWSDALLAYAAQTARVGREGSGAGAAGSGTVKSRLSALAELRARAELREGLGDVAEARDVLLRIAGVLDGLDHAGPQVAHEAAQNDTKKRRRRT